MPGLQDLRGVHPEGRRDHGGRPHRSLQGHPHRQDLDPNESGNGGTRPLLPEVAEGHQGLQGDPDGRDRGDGGGGHDGHQGSFGS